MFTYLNLMMKVTPLAPASSMGFFRVEMLFFLCLPTIASGYLGKTVKYQVLINYKYCSLVLQNLFPYFEVLDLDADPVPFDVNLAQKYSQLSDWFVSLQRSDCPCVRQC